MRGRILSAAVVAAALILALTASSGADGSASVTFTIDPSAGRQTISPLIYGINGDATSSGSSFSADAPATAPTVVRLGGNRWTAYNWTNGYSNAGADYCYENDNYLDGSASPGGAVQGTVEADTAAGRTTVLTIPITGYVSADANQNPPSPSSNVDSGCPQDVRNSGSSYLSTRFAPMQPSGPVTDVPSGSTVYANQFADWLRLHESSAPLIFSLDNEPDFWSSTHPEVHPGPTGYQELANADIAYAQAVKSVLPGAEVTGPVLGGWDGLWSLDNPSEYSAHGNFTDYWLQRVAAASRLAGTTLIDAFDLHWYPQPTKDGSYDVYGNDTSAATVAEREQRPRSLWDPTYVENSYITQPYAQGGENSGPIALIPRIQGQIATDNPGMKLAITEWNYGASGDISGGIADADALGVFGRYGVHLATFWPSGPLAGSFAAGAFQMFRNYNSGGGHFGDTEVQATTSDVGHTSVYASTEANDPSRLVIVAINKNSAATSATINLQQATSYGDAAVYTLTASGGSAPRQAASIAPIRPHQYSYTMPAQSVSVIVPLPAQSGSGGGSGSGSGGSGSQGGQGGSASHPSLKVHTIKLSCLPARATRSVRCVATVVTAARVGRIQLRLWRGRTLYADGSTRPRTRHAKIQLTLDRALGRGTYQATVIVRLGARSQTSRIRVRLA
ncbi:MAG TPA: glycoside hydrolase family 44 protein [Solirubrobacteraceae bacterium]|nr:glycoside hydrolase family 44 protein [Solirubrobacteraceae bacterium]